jgi:RNA polymerase sigma-70 factor (ECF subfamily)
VGTNPLDEAPTPEPARTPAPVLLESLDVATSTFQSFRPRLLAVAERIVGTHSEAEEVVQDAWLRWQLADRASVHEPAAFLVTTTTRLALNVVQSARRRHESFTVPAPPDRPDTDIAPEAVVEQRDAVAEALRLLMERLSPTERAAYILRIGFAYPYRRISEVLHVGVGNARQVVRRAQQRLATGRRREVSAVAHQRLVQTFLVAAQNGELAQLESLLATQSAAQLDVAPAKVTADRPALALATGS